MRIDIYLKLIGIFKTRTIANKACKAGYVSISEKKVNSSKEIHEGDILGVVKPDGSVLTIEVLKIPSMKQVSRKDRQEYFRQAGPER